MNTASKTGFGTYLVDAKGMTLYYFTRDKIGNSSANATVLQTWPIFNPASFTVPAALNDSDFSSITRIDGQKQATYKGWPLYYYANDKAPGDTAGDNVGGVWFAIKVPFYTVMLQTKADLGNYLVDARGMTLYYTTRDAAGKSNITGTTLQNWPIFNVDTFIAPSSLNASEFGVMTRDDGQMQATYRSWPLYYYVNDKASGDTTGQGVAGVWFVISPDKFPPSLTPSPTPSPTPSSSSGY